MLYLSEFTFPDVEDEVSFIMAEKRKCYDTFYPFRILSRRSLRRLAFEPITILYGGNGSGKTTAVNVIAETLHLKRDALYNRSNFFEDYTGMCEYETRASVPDESRIITSDDVFDYMLICAQPMRKSIISAPSCLKTMSNSTPRNTPISGSNRLTTMMSSSGSTWRASGRRPSSSAGS